MVMLFLFIVLAIPVCNLLWWWWADWKLRGMARARLWRVLVAVLVLSQLAVYAYLLRPRLVPIGALVSRPVLTVAYVWHMVVLPLSLIVIAGVGVVMGAVRGGRALSRWRSGAGHGGTSVEVGTGGRAARGTSVRLTRREALGAAAVWAAPLVTVAAAGRALSQVDSFRIRRFDVPVLGLPPDLEGMTIAQVADAHVGRFTRGRVLAEIAGATNRLQADLVLMPGDLIDRALADLPEALAMVSRIDPRNGLFLCQGNHDLFESRAGFDAGVRAAGLKLLVNQATDVRVRGVDVQVLGLRWGGSGGGRGAAIAENMAELEGARRPGAFQILMAHHPHAFDAGAAAGIPLTLSGHTHGGQLMLGGRVGAGPMIFRYWSGMYQKGNASLVVSNGVGNWFPLRTWAPAEIVLVTLRPGTRLA